MQINYLWSNQLFSRSGKGRGGAVRPGSGERLRRPPRRRARLSRWASGVGPRPHPGGPVVRKLPRGGLREERGGTLGGGRDSSATSQLEGAAAWAAKGRLVWGEGREKSLACEFFPSFLHSFPSLLRPHCAPLCVQLRAVVGEGLRAGI